MLSKIAQWRKDNKALEKYRFVYHFLPNPVEKKRASLLSARSFFAYIILAVVLMGLFRIIPRFFPGVLGYASDINIRDLLNYTNQERKNAGLEPLVLNAKLSAAAKDKAEHMFRNNYWAHVSPDGTEPWSFILGEGYDYVYAGENLAKNFSTSKDVVVAWMESATHRENLLNKNYKEIGFASVNGILNGYETTLVVQMFGKPRDLSSLASKADEQKLLDELSPEVSQKTSLVPVSVIPNSSPTPLVNVLPYVDVDTASRGISISFAVFVFVLLSLDIWYSTKKGIFKFNGHTYAHLIFFLFVLFSIWFVLRPGTIL